MKEEKTKSKKKLIYYLILAVSVLLLIAATVLTVYFVTADPSSSTLDVPPQNDPSGPDEPGNVDPLPPDEPSGGQTVRFISPVQSSAHSEYASIYGNKVLRWYYRHKAIDFAADEGASIVAMSDGVVETIYIRPETGNYVVINHGDNLRAVYRFIEISDTLRVGTAVKQGDKIGEVAAAYGIEKEDGTHLHLEMTKDKKSVNPLDYINVVFEEK